MDDGSPKPKRKHGVCLTAKEEAEFFSELRKRRSSDSDGDRESESSSRSISHSEHPSTSATPDLPTEPEQGIQKEYVRNGQFLYSEEREEDKLLYGQMRLAIRSYYCGSISLETLAKTVTLGVACRVGDVALTAALLEAGFGDFPDDRGWFPIHEAAFGLHIDCCRVLIESGKANLDAQAHDGVTPLLLVCRKQGNQRKACDLATLLLEHGAKVDASSFDGMTPFLQAVRSQNIELADVLLEYKADPRKTWYGNWSALHEAACRHDAKTMKRLLDMSVDVFVVDDERHTPLIVAVQERSIECVKLLLEAAKDRAAELANVCISKRNVSCVMAAVSEGYDDVLQVLLEYGADCNAIMDKDWGISSDGRKGMHPITEAALRGYSRCMEQLLPHVDKEILSTTEIGPMTGAAYSGSCRCIDILLNAGYPTEELVSTQMDAMIIPYLRPLFVREYYTPLREAVRRGHTKSVQRLVRAGAKMVYSTRCFSPFLFAFRMVLDPEILRCFLEHDVDVNLISENSDYTVPDALLSILGDHNREKLLLLLLSGLKPNLEHWCACQNKKGLSLLKNVSQFDYVGDLKDLMHLLAAFSPRIPSCCREVADVVECEPQIGSLAQLCRIAIRRNFLPSQLLDERWMKKFEGFPRRLKGYLKFGSRYRSFN